MIRPFNSFYALTLIATGMMVASGCTQPYLTSEKDFQYTDAPLVKAVPHPETLDINAGSPDSITR